jgi:alpha-2-macroglobulin
MTSRFRTLLSALLILSQFTCFFERAAISQVRRPPRPQVNETRKGLQLKLSEGAPVEERLAPVATAPAAKLSDSEAQNVLKRLQPIKNEPDDQQDFAIRDRSLPAPRTGKTIEASFPPSEKIATPEQAETGPLAVLRYSPEGDVPLAPQLSVTFSQPMVAVTSHADATADGLPVRLTPQPPGHWRWVGTKTLLFEPDIRFPMATAYTAEIPGGTKSATGATLGAAKSWKFATPPPQVKSSYPNDGPTIRDPLMFVEFDQRIDPALVIDTVRVRSGDREWKTRLARSDEVEADETVSKLAARATKDRWLAFRVVDPNNAGSPLPAGSTVNVTIGPGTPSAEGPVKTAAAQNFSFRTFGMLRVTEHQCGYRETCTPFDQWTVRFTNPLDAGSFEQSHVRVEEILPGAKKGQAVSLKSAVYGNMLVINGIKRGRTSYRVTLDSSIRDQFGQTLGANTPIVFNVGAAPPALAGPDKPLVVLDPAGQPRLSVYSINHNSLRVRLYSVGPEQWGQFLLYWRNRSNSRTPGLQTPPGKLALSRVVTVQAQPDEMVETRIDIAPALEGGFGQVLVVVEPSIEAAKGNRDTVAVWAQITQIGLDAFVDSSELVGWATSLKDGTPIDGAQISVDAAGAASLRSEATGTTHADGIAHIPLIGGTNQVSRILVARKGRDVAILPENNYWWGDQSGWVKKAPGFSLRWFVFDDRKMYRPGEEVHVKGWIRRVGDGKDGDVNSIDDASSGVDYVLKDSRGNEVFKGTAQVNALGGFDTVFKLPATMNLGYAILELRSRGNEAISSRQHAHQFQVQEFRRPEFEVTAQATEGPHFVGASATTTVNAAYYAGGGLSNAEVTWRVTTSTARFTPPNRGDFTFGKWIPWWIDRSSYSETRVETFAGRTDAAGKHTLRMDFISVDPPQPSTVTAEASVTDVNRQAWTASTNLLVHPADLYVGVRSPRTFVQKGEPLIVQSIVADLDGKLITGREIKMRAVLMDWVFEKGEWKQQEKNPQECAVKSAAGPVECRFETKEGGQYQVTATILDDRERKNESELTLWVAGGKTVPKRDVEQEDVQLIPDRKDYGAGDTAEVLVQAPFFPAEGVLTLRRSGLVSVERFKMDGPSHTLRIPIKEGYTPNLHVQVDLVGAAVRTDDEGKPQEKLPKRPAFAKGELNLQIPPLARELAVEAKPRDKALEPGGETTVDVEVRDAAGKPVAGSELAVVVVDEAILGLTGYRIGDPISTFYTQRGADVSDRHLRQDVLLAAPEDLAGRLRRGMGGGGGGGGVGQGVGPAAAPRTFYMKREAIDSLAAMVVTTKSGESEAAEAIRVRQNFNALATFAAAVPTDANGRATIKVKLPDSLTRYRVMAIAVAGGKQFGANESTITARLPLMVRPSAPRFLNFGDKFELPVVVQNQTDSPMNVDVAVRASNAELTAGGGRRVTVPANDRVEVRFPVSAARAGTARFQIAGVSGKWADAAEIELPVWTPATTEAFATYGEIDEGAITQPVKAPSDAIKQFGGLEITTSSTELQALTDAVLYLVAYPFECSEQLSSRVLGIAALKDVLAAFKAKGLPEPKEMIDAVARDLKRLQTMQNDDGGFAFWRRGDEAWPYVSIHVAHALVRAKDKGFDVPASMMDRSKKYLREIESHIPAYYGPVARRSLIAYSLYVRNLMGDRDTARARRLIAEGGLDGLSLEGIGWLLSVLSGDAASQTELAAIRKHLNNRATEEAATAHFVTSYGDGDYLLLHSDRRTDGVILEALIKDQPSSDLIPKLVRGLLGHRKQGRWENTQENAFVLLALDKYFATYEKVTPDFVARAWLGDAYAGGHEFRGRSTERQNVNVPMRFLSETSAPQNLILAKEGAGRLYYRVGMQYAPASLKLEPSEHGFTVERVYEAVDKADDVRKDADGTWHIKAGARVRVKLTMLVASRRYHVALVDPIPAGLEALNPALAVTGSVPRDPTDKTTDQWWWWRRPWFEHQNMRDERVEAFASLVWEGVHTYSYVARATTPGVFVVPPAKAEEMYHPETFGRGGTDRVIVE